MMFIVVDLPAPLGPRKTVDLTLFHTEREMIYGNMVTIFFCKIAYFYHICLPDMV